MANKLRAFSTNNFRNFFAVLLPAWIAMAVCVYAQALDPAVAAAAPVEWYANAGFIFQVFTFLGVLIGGGMAWQKMKSDGLAIAKELSAWKTENAEDVKEMKQQLHNLEMKHVSPCDELRRIQGELWGALNKVSDGQAGIKEGLGVIAERTEWIKGIVLRKDKGEKPE